MNVPVLFCVIVVHLRVLHGFPTEKDFNTTELVQDEFGDYLQTHDKEVEGRSRKPRRIIRKIHNGIAFLAGVKVGTLLAQKGFEAGHGSLAATNSFQMFGKPINSAISLSYGGGSIGQKLPIVNDVPINTTEDKKTRTADEDILHLTLIRNPTNDTIEKLKKISSVSVSDAGHDVVVLDHDLFQDTTTESSSFLQQHNDRVREFNSKLQRTNSKF